MTAWVASCPAGKEYPLPSRPRAGSYDAGAGKFLLNSRPQGLRPVTQAHGAGTAREVNGHSHRMFSDLPAPGREV